MSSTRVRLRRAIVQVAAALTCVAVVSGARSASGETPDYQAWIQGLRTEAMSLGIAEATLDEALAGVEPIPRVVELDRNQPEFTQTLEQYLARVVSEARVEMGRDRVRENRDLLQRVERRYGVDHQFIVALWGIETDFGRLTGGFPVIPALVTMAYDGRRSHYFRGELLDALRILDAGHIELENMQGSWAGAMGQPQFMPSSFLRYAADFDGDGRIDIWTNRADVFASAANYLSRSGWIKGQKWGRPVRLPMDLDGRLFGLETRKSLREWQALGLRRADGGDLPHTPNLSASLIRPDGEGGRAFLVYENYRTILRWNRSHLFGIAVGTLADRIASP